MTTSENLVPIATAAIAMAFGALLVIYREDPVFCRGNTRQKKLHRVGGAIPFLGDAITATSNLDRFWDFMLETFLKTNNEPFILKLPMSPAVIVTNDPKCLECVLKTEFSVFDKGPRFQHVFHDFLGHGIFNVDGDEWKSQRKLAANIFNVKNFKNYVRDVFSSEMESFCKILDLRAETSQEFDLQELFFRFTFDSFTRIGFGVEVNTMSADGPVAFMTAFDAIQTRCAKRMMTAAWWGITEYWSGQSRVHDEQIKLIREFGKSIIGRKRDSGMTSTEFLSANDLLSLLMVVKDEKGNNPTDDTLVEYVLNFLLAGKLSISSSNKSPAHESSLGRDTTACALSWAVYLLHKNPDTHAKLLQEIATILNASTPTYEHIRNKMPYANAVFHETLRLYPSVPSNMKEANKDVTLPDGTFVPKGCCVSWSPYVMGRTEAIWGPDAREFKPERWLTMEKQPSPFDYPAFQAGPRVCLGKSMAELEGVYVLVELNRRFKIEVVNENDIQYAFSILIPMKNGLKVKCTPRDWTGQ
ncbi:UNVERIFIED_CONTAM: hypothetical protein HDU68_006584 [Siphonaria sp. JEL0065]|nr:hypothetical protein HDU68_006584 [Siphonaria sp. JEL0065]